MLHTTAELSLMVYRVQFPPPLNSKFNPNTPSAQIDYEMTKPLAASGADFPCKGYQSLLGSSAGAPTASFAVGSKVCIQMYMCTLFLFFLVVPSMN